MKLLLFASFFLLMACDTPPPPASSGPDSWSQVPAQSEFFRFTGRFWPSDSGMRYAWSASRIDLRFQGTAIHLLLEVLPGAESAKPLTEYLLLRTDGKDSLLVLEAGAHRIRLENLRDTVHDVILFKRTEALVAEGLFLGAEIPPGASMLAAQPALARRIEVIGNSITCGYGNEGIGPDCSFSAAEENAWYTYGHMAAQELGADYQAVCYSGKGVFQNYDRSHTGTMPELWQQRSPQDTALWEGSPAPDWLLINLGTNDFAHGDINLEAFRAEYEELIRTVRSRYPQAKILCLTGSMMQGRQLATLGNLLDRMVAELSGAGVQGLYRFELSPQGELGYGCDWHPSVAQQQRNGAELSAWLSQNW